MQRSNVILPTGRLCWSNRLMLVVQKQCPSVELAGLFRRYSDLRYVVVVACLLLGADHWPQA